MLQIKFDWIRVPEKKALSTPALSKPDMGPQSSPNARAAIIRQAPCSVPFRMAVTSAIPGVAKYCCIRSAA